MASVAVGAAAPALPHAELHRRFHMSRRAVGSRGEGCQINHQPTVASPTHSFQEGAVNCLVGIEAALQHSALGAR